MTRLAAFAIVLVLVAAGARAATATIAVASNFAATLEALQPDFEAETGHALRVVRGSTGKLHAQIVAGAPYDVFLSADRASPARLEADGLAAPNGRFVYAVGRLALWSADPSRLKVDARATLAAGGFRALAIANPTLAPYGAAARETLQAWGLWAQVSPRVVYGQNVGQAFAMAAIGGADLALVSLAQTRDPASPPGAALPVRAGHAPIRQDAALLARGADNPAARSFLAWLRDDPGARATIRAFGYDAAESDDE